jgi:hypothetical protein
MRWRSPFLGLEIPNDCMCIFADLLRGESDATFDRVQIYPDFMQKTLFILGIKATFETLSENYDRQNR